MKHYTFTIWFSAVLVLILSSVSLFIVNYPKSRVTVTDDEIRTVADVIKKSGITMEDGIVPKTVAAMPGAEADGVFRSVEEVAETVFKEDYEHDGSVFYKDDVYVSFNPSISIHSKKPVLQDKLKKLTFDNAPKKMRQILNSYDIKTENVLFETYKNVSVYNIVVTRKFGKLPIYNNALVFEISPSGLSSVSGLWFDIHPKKTRHIPKSPIDAILTFSEDPNNYGNHIIQLNIGYKLSTESETEHAELIPVWRILTGDGGVHYIEA